MGGHPGGSGNRLLRVYRVRCRIHGRGRSRTPRRDLPIGIIGSLIVCTVIYIVVAAVFTGIIPYQEIIARLSSEQAEPLTLALDYAHIGGLAVFIVALGSVIAHTAVLFVFQLGQPRIFFSMARDGLLPPLFAKVHPKYRTPWGSTILTGVAVGTAAMFTSLNEMVDLTNIGTLFAFILVSIGIIVLRVKDPDRERPFRVPGGMVLPILAIIGCVGLIALPAAHVLAALHRLAECRLLDLRGL